MENNPEIGAFTIRATCVMTGLCSILNTVSKRGVLVFGGPCCVVEQDASSSNDTSAQLK